ncbi:hypothetical protein ACSBR1_012445 [Camellia fascicularis]
MKWIQRMGSFAYGTDLISWLWIDKGHKEWINEMNLLHVVEHPNLVKLVGYCAEDDERGIQRHLVGQIPLSTPNLAKLTRLFLSNNNLNGQLPDSIGNMSGLAFLNLSGNQLTGPIPLYTIGFSRLAYLDLKDNSLNGTIPSRLFTLPSLVSKELRHNKLQGQILGSIYELTNLTHLLLKLKYLSYLDLSYNGLSLSINNSVNSAMPKFYTIGSASCNFSEFPNFLRA